MFHCRFNGIDIEFLPYHSSHINYSDPSLLWCKNFDSSLKITLDHCSAVHFLWTLTNTNWAFLCREVSLGFLLRLRQKSPASLSFLLVVDEDTLTPCSSSISAFILGQSSCGQIYFFAPWSCPLSLLSSSFFLGSFCLLHNRLTVVFYWNTADAPLAAAHSGSNLSLGVALLCQCQYLSSILEADPWLRPMVVTPPSVLWKIDYTYYFGIKCCGNWSYLQLSLCFRV